MLTVAWSLYDEFYGLRPWLSYQNRFIARVCAVSPGAIEAAKGRRSRDESHAGVPEAAAALKSATDAAAPADARLSAEMDLLDQQRAAMTDAFQRARGKVGALIYQLERFPLPTRMQRLPN